MLLLDFDVLINKGVKNPVIFCGVINSKFDYDFYLNLKKVLNKKYNISPYFVIFENIPDINSEEYYYNVLNKVETMLKETYYSWMDFNNLELFYFGEYKVFRCFYEILIHSVNNKKVTFHFINSKKNKKQNQVSFIINFNLDNKKDGNNE